MNAYIACVTFMWAPVTDCLEVVSLSMQHFSGWYILLYDRTLQVSGRRVYVHVPQYTNEKVRLVARL